MVPTYTSKGDRRYRYYVCRVAQEKGRSACPTKSVAAGLIEESVVAQVRAALTAEDTREKLEISETDWRAFDENEPGDLVRRIVQRVVYDGTSGAVSLELGK
jgi:site-specific DNA recombinase